MEFVIARLSSSQTGITSEMSLVYSLNMPQQTVCRRVIVLDILRFFAARLVPFAIGQPLVEFVDGVAYRTLAGIEDRKSVV